MFGALQGARDQSELSIPGQEEGGKGVPKLEACQVLPALPHQMFCCWSPFCTSTMSVGCCEHTPGFPAECYMVNCLGCREMAPAQGCLMGSTITPMGAQGWERAQGWGGTTDPQGSVS